MMKHFFEHAHRAHEEGHRHFRHGFGHGFGREFGRGMGGWGGRARRGDVKFLVLEVLAESPRHGYEIIRAIEERRGFRPSPGSIYPTLQMLEDQGFIKGVDEGGKRRYDITEEGRAHLADNPRHAAPWDEVAGGADPVRVQLHDAGKHVMMAAHQVMEVGTDSQRAEALKLLVDARRRLYVLLAADAGDDQSATAGDPVADEGGSTIDA